MGADYRVRYAKSVLEFMCNGIQVRKAYDRVDSYRMILALFLEAGAVGPHLQLVAEGDGGHAHVVR